MRKTIETLDEEIEFEDNTIQCLTEKIGISQEKFIKQIEQVNLTGASITTDGVIERLNKTPKKQREVEFLTSINNYRKL